MGFFDNDRKEDDYDYGIFNSIMKPKKNDNNKNKEIKKQVGILGLFDDEIEEIKDNGYEPDDFEDDEVEDGDYYGDEE